MQILQKSQCALCIGTTIYNDIEIIEAIINDGFNQDNKAILQIATIEPFNFDCLQQSAEIILGNQLRYKGIVTQLALKESAKQDVIEIKLNSALFHLDNDQSNRIYSQRHLQAILQDICNEHCIQLYYHRQQNDKMLALATQHQQTAAEFMQDLLAKQQLFYYSQHDAITILDSFPQDDEIELSYHSLLSLQQQTQIKQYSPLQLSDEFILKSTNNKLKAGNIIKIHDHPHRAFNQRFRLLRVKHYYQKTYFNECQLQLLERPYACQAPAQAYIGLQQGKIIGNDHAQLDEQGQYQVQMPGQKTIMNLHSIRKLVHFSGDGYGHHFPLYANSPALIAYINGDINQPVIIGSLPDKQHSNVVSQHNQNEKQLQFSAQQFMGFSQKQQASLTIRNQAQTLHLNAHSGAMTLHNNSNNIEFVSAQSIKQQCSQVFQQEINGESRWLIKNNLYCKAQQIKMQFENDGNILLCEKTLFLSSAKLSWKIKQFALQCQALNIDIQNLHLQTTDKFILSGKKLDFNISSLSLRCGNSSISVDKVGNLYIKSPEVNVYAKKIGENGKGKLRIN